MIESILTLWFECQEVLWFWQHWPIFDNLFDVDAEMATLVLFLIAKATIAGGTMIIFQFGGELYPTEVRGVGIGAASFLGNFMMLNEFHDGTNDNCLV